MDLLSREELTDIMEAHAEPCVSILMPTVRAGAEVRQNSLRLKNLLKTAEDQLTANGMRGPEAKKLLEMAEDLLHDRVFWQHQSDGLAVYISPDYFDHFILPLKLEEQVVVGDRFYIRPLLPLFSADGRFYVLAFSQNNVRLLEGTRYSVNEVDLKDMPTSLAEALRFDDPEKQLQFYTSESPSPGGGGRQTAMFHGHGAGHDDAKTNILRYFQKVDAGLQDLLADEKAPLVLAGVEYLHPIFREASQYKNLAESGITGNPDEIKPEQLHAQAWEIVKPAFEKDQAESADLFRQAEGGPTGSSDVAEIVAAAHFGRVERLFVALGESRWGALDPETGEVRLDDGPAPGNQDLLDLAAVRTWLNNGRVFVVEPSQMPADAPLAAVLRY